MSIVQLLFRNYRPRDFTTQLWDGSSWGPESGVPSRFTFVFGHPRSIRSILLHPSEQALGHAYVCKDVDIEGDLEEALPMARYLLKLRLGITEKTWLAYQLSRLPGSNDSRTVRRAVKLRGSVHSADRDRQAVTYHYDTSNEFFSLFLDSRMVYSCAYFQSTDESLDRAQERKLDYVCRKLRLQRGQRLLDIGCGWGGLILFAVQHYGVTGLGITLSEPQARLANERLRREGLTDRCRIEVRDYRTLTDAEEFDAVASIGMVEHVGQQMLPEYFAQAWRLLRPGGVFLNHGIARAATVDRDPTGSFIQAYVFPDSDPVPIGASTTAAEDAGFEVRDVESLREHYALTLRHWTHRLESHRVDAISAAGEATYRTWKLFMTASALEFDSGQNNLYQSLLVKPDDGKSGMPFTRADWYC